MAHLVRYERRLWFNQIPLFCFFTFRFFSFHLTLCYLFSSKKRKQLPFLFGCSIATLLLWFFIFFHLLLALWFNGYPAALKIVTFSFIAFGKVELEVHQFYLFIYFVFFYDDIFIFKTLKSINFILNLFLKSFSNEFKIIFYNFFKVLVK